MNKKIIVIPIVAIIVIALVGFSADKPTEKKNIAFHATLANPELYVDGVYTDAFTIKQGEYYFRFVPNGSSPKVLSITINGDSFEYTEDFKRVGTPHQTGISEYYTWDYDGQKNITILETQQVSIVINPNSETIGSVSVDILEN